ncbi:hypothetical protein [Roseateles sp. BYS87W]|uniref:Uncharacterized protein n=1 Tax=Pelomonas baiyunensis TaxID=3299026 RepID=A0ABW7H459_9BURK
MDLTRGRGDRAHSNEQPHRETDHQLYQPHAALIEAGRATAVSWSLE